MLVNITEKLILSTKTNIEQTLKLKKKMKMMLKKKKRLTGLVGLVHDRNIVDQKHTAIAD